MISKDMKILEIIQKYPETSEVFYRFGISCIGCAAARFETLEQGAKAHGIDVEKLITELNKAVDKK